MPRAAYLIEIQPADIATIAYACGVLTAQGIPQGQVLANMLDNIQMVEVPDDFYVDEAQGFQNEDATVLDFPSVPAAEEELEEEASFLEEVPAPVSSPVYYPRNSQSDFGAGPPGRT